MAVSRRQHEKKLIRQVFNSEMGRELLAYWRNTFVDQGCYDDSTEKAYYNMGQQQFVLSILKDIDNADSISAIKLIQH